MERSNVFYELQHTKIDLIGGAKGNGYDILFCNK